MDQFPIPAPPHDGSSRLLGPGSAFDWFRQGWAIFTVNPAVWIAMMVIVIVIYVGLAVIPVIGYLAAYLLTPLLAAGMLLVCRKAAIGESLEISDLFAGFKRDTGALMTLGVFYMLAMLLLFVLVFLFLGGGIAGGLVLANPLGAGIALGGSAQGQLSRLPEEPRQLSGLCAADDGPVFLCRTAAWPRIPGPRTGPGRLRVCFVSRHLHYRLTGLTTCKH